MRLKKIKLAGFKSFVDPTSIPFPGDMTAIVGPNGCGKSNVIDAVRWVLGESSAKNLRGDAMTDVIFNGSSSRKPVGQCSVELVFDNSAGRIGGEYARYNELSVKRIVTRDAQSGYLLNNVKCRRRDITDLFLGTGLGPRSYAIIEQGMISRLIESKPQELRVFIEEAAGISRYKERRRETENRIRHTQENLERLEDVRGELGQQIEKLQRQAAAANRYKTLKASERRLKAELAAMRWLNFNALADKLTQEHQKQLTELDALLARQRGDEAGVEQYRLEVETLRESADASQKTLFDINTAIARIEQDEKYARQRDEQIDREISGLRDQLSALNQSLEEAEGALTAAQQAQDSLAPEAELTEARLEQAMHQREEAESALTSFTKESRERETRFNELKHQSQSLHGKIQSMMAMQLRTTQRLGELLDERRQLLAEDHGEPIASLAEACETARAQSEEAAQQESAAAETRVLYQQQEAEAASALQQAQGQLQNIQAHIHALSALNESEQSDEVNSEHFAPLWATLDVRAGDEEIIERVLKMLHDPVIAETESDIWQQGSEPAGKVIFSKMKMTTDKRPGSVATCIITAAVPAIFNNIGLAGSVAEAQAQLSKNASGSVIVREGPWLFSGGHISAGASTDGAIKRRARLAELALQAEALGSSVEQARHRFDEVKSLRLQAEDRLALLSEQRLQARVNLQRAESALEVATREQQQRQLRAEKINQEIAAQEAVQNEEAAELETLSEKLEALEEARFTAEDEVEHLQHERERYAGAAEEARRQYESLIAQQHQQQLALQQHQSQYQRYQEQVTRNRQQKDSFHQRLSVLEEEKRQLHQPRESQEAVLQGYLEKREEEDARRIALQNDMEERLSLIRDAEKDQHGRQQLIAERRKVMDALSVDIEGHRVRANAVLEQLTESGQTLKTVLETLPQETNEKQWQQELEKTTSAISRLGAVNLAAVEEFEVQSERKAHLDAQFDDLVEALDTLQSAIRKIDKETRSRFSATFEQVNEDLKTLFPKVFGGGAAYLALTDDDLLETGVTIMARPPGKKNSTIHLLSGGEKALTALSLVFAIFRLNPAPFCLLDEVDAPLDDANVGRFCKLVSEMSKTVQFIYITHNKIAMEMASHLTGVTMAEPGVSRMVAVDVDEAVTFANA